MQKPNIILTGFMGTGKTTIGKRLAKELSYNFIDTDVMIEKRAGRTIQKIFEELGESAFRKMESAVVSEIAGMQGQVIATGGRLMLDPGNAAALSQTGMVFCLVATAEEIFERVSKDNQNVRPLLAGEDPMARIVNLLEQRKDGYGRFSQIETSLKTPDEIVNILLARFQIKFRSTIAHKRQ
ncbi:shikimate kinase [Desulfosarcina ovata]|nr:shikimate kinase [Desulfosarcina ovata]